MSDYLGTHLIVDLWGVPQNILNNPDFIKSTLVDAVEKGNATLIDIHVHQFSPHGITGTATLSESHICIHTWPEEKFAAVDVFICGRDGAYQAVECIKQAFQPEKFDLTELKRGLKNLED